MRYFFALFMLSSCVIARPQYSQKISKSEVDNVIDFAMNYLGSDLEPGWNVVLYDGYIPNFFVDKNGVWQVALADGRTKKEEKIIEVFVYDECLASSSLIHELVHALGYEHEDKEIWQTAAVLYKEAIKHFCGEGYQKEEPPQINAEAMSYLQSVLVKMNQGTQDD